MSEHVNREQVLLINVQRPVRNPEQQSHPQKPTNGSADWPAVASLLEFANPVEVERGRSHHNHEPNQIEFVRSKPAIESEFRR